MPLTKRLGWIGVDIGTHAVKLAQVVRTPAGVQLHRAAVIQRTTDWSGDDALAHDQPQSSAAEIRAALECGGFSGRDAVCVPPMSICELRGVNVPPGSEAERRTIIRGELEEEWAERRIQMEFDYWELESGKADKGSDAFNVNVLATSRPWVLQMARDCQHAGLDCWAVDGLPLALARAVALVGGSSGGQRTLAIDWGYANTTLCVVSDGRPLYARRIHDCSFGKVLDAVVNVLGITTDEARHLVDTQGLALPESGVNVNEDRRTQAAIADAVRDVVEELVRQIGRTLRFMESQRRHLRPEELWLMGGGASMHNIGPHLTGEVGLPVHVWQMPAQSREIPCASGGRAALFGGAAALSALAWGAA